MESHGIVWWQRASEARITYPSMYIDAPDVQRQWQCGCMRTHFLHGGAAGQTRLCPVFLDVRKPEPAVKSLSRSMCIPAPAARSILFLASRRSGRPVERLRRRRGCAHFYMVGCVQICTFAPSGSWISMLLAVSIFLLLSPARVAPS